MKHSTLQNAEGEIEFPLLWNHGVSSCYAPDDPMENKMGAEAPTVRPLKRGGYRTMLWKNDEFSMLLKSLSDVAK